MKLTKTIIEAAKYTGEAVQGGNGRTHWPRCVLWDNEVKGLGVRITPQGAKTFVLSYRIGRRKRMMKLGRVGELTLVQARERARRALVQTMDGEDPLAIKERQREGLLVRELATRYIAEHAKPKKKPASAREDQRLLDLHILPTLGGLPVAEVQREDVARVHHRMRETPIQANRVLALMSKMFGLAEQWGLRPDHTNPTRHVQRYKERKRERYLTIDEVTRLGEVLRKEESIGFEQPEALAAIRLLLLTGCRKNEVLTLRWQDVDLQRGFIVFPDSKTGQKIIPLTPAVVDVLEHIPRVQGNPYVLVGRGGKGHFIGLFHAWERIREKASLQDVRIHDLRHSFASFGAGGGLGLPILGKLLGHRNAATTERYAHLADDPVRMAAEGVAGEIARALGASASSPPGS